MKKNLVILFSIFCFLASPAFAMEGTMFWDENPDATSLIIEYGTESGVYTNRMEVPNFYWDKNKRLYRTSCRIVRPDLGPGTYYFRLTGKKVCYFGKNCSKKAVHFSDPTEEISFIWKEKKNKTKKVVKHKTRKKEAR